MRKHLIKIFLLVIFLSSFAFSSNVSELMQKGNEYYKNNQFQLAIDEYNKLVSEGYEGASLYYNLGNAHYRLGKIGYAIMYYEKALKFAPSDEDIIHNLAFARLNLKDKVDTLPSFFIFNLWEGLVGAFSVTGWTIISYIFFILFLVGAVAYFFSRNSNQQRISFFGGASLLLLLIISIVLLNVKMNKEYKLKDGIIVSSVATAKYGPDTTQKDVFVIHEGLKVRLLDRVDNWVKIRLDDGKIGWIPDQDMGEI
jgi:tetratricopeptide (TPR) repeat protein